MKNQDVKLLELTEETLEETSGNYNEIAQILVSKNKWHQQLTKEQVDPVVKFVPVLFNKLLGLEERSEVDEEPLELLKSAKEGALKLLSYNVCKNDTKSIRASCTKLFLDLLPLCKSSLKKQLFPVEVYAECIHSVCSSTHDSTPTLDAFTCFSTGSPKGEKIWWSIQYLLYDRQIELNQKYVQNLLQILNTLPKDPLPVTNSTGGSDKKRSKTNELSKVVTKVWNRLSLVEVSLTVQQLLLLTLLERFMTRMDRPIFLTDYFISVLNNGGPVGILGLQGIFVLIQKCNIECPNVYNKLYSMFTAEIFSASYKSRFYFLADVFLTSTHLPEALVAGFAKRLARLSLLAPPEDAVIICIFIMNLIIRHNGLKTLINALEPDKTSIENDPYDPTEIDPSKSKAMDSSLWEIKLLQDHVLPSVSSAASFVSNPLPSVERHLGEYLDVTTGQIFNREWKKKLKEIPTTFDKPTSMFVPLNETRPFSSWNFKT